METLHLKKKSELKIKTGWIRNVTSPHSLKAHRCVNLNGCLGCSPLFVCLSLKLDGWMDKLAKIKIKMQIWGPGVVIIIIIKKTCWFQEPFFFVVVNTRYKKSSYFLSGLLPLWPLTVRVNKTSSGEWTGTKLSSFVGVSYVPKHPCCCVPACTCLLSNWEADSTLLFQRRAWWFPRQ